MATTRKVSSYLLAAALVTSVSGAATAEESAAQSTVDPQADALLKKMSDYMGGLQSFAADVQITDQHLLADGFKLSLLKQGKVQVVRPDKLHLTRKGLVRDQEAFFNGKELVFHAKKLGIHVLVPVEGDIDSALDAAATAFGQELPARDLMSKDAYTPLMESVEEAVYIGVVPVGDMSCHQLAFRAEQVDWQLWIQDGDEPVPCRYSITSKWLAAAPQFTLSFSNWQINPSIPAETFQFSPPDSEKSVSPDEYRAAGDE